MEKANGTRSVEDADLVVGDIDLFDDPSLNEFRIV
jgi:hypothetical protein